MADLKISEMTALSELIGAEVFPLIQSGMNKRCTATQIREFCIPIDVSDEEIAEGVTVVRDIFPVGDIRRYCSADEEDHTEAFAAAFAVSATPYAPSAEFSPTGTWNVNYVLIDMDDRELLTDGFATVIKQIGSPSNLNRRILEICANNIKINDLKLAGNIATDTGEQQHGIVVSGNHPVEVAHRDISNIIIGNVIGEDIRGDVLIINAPVGAATVVVKFGIIIGYNIYRNVVSCVGGTQIDGVGIYTDGGCGYVTFDIEPDGASISSDIRIGFIRGGTIQCAPPSSVAYRIYIGTCDLDPAYQPNCSPGYSEGGSSYAVQIRNAVNLRNTVGFEIGYLRMRDHGYFGIDYIFNLGEQRGQNIRIGYLDSNNVGASETTINALLNFGQVESATIEDGNVVLQTKTDYVLAGNSSTRNNKFIVNRLTLDGTLVRFCSKSKFSNIFRNDANSAVLIRECDDSILEVSDVTAPTFLTNVTGFVVLASKVTCSGTYLNGTCSNIEFIACSGGLASVLAGSATYDPPSLADGAGATTTLTMTGVALGDYVTRVAFSLDLQGITLTGYVSSANTGSFRFQNESGGLLDISSGTLTAKGAKA